MKILLAAALIAFSVAVAAPAAAEAQSRPEVKMYATSWCPYCAKARAYFSRRGIAYVEVDVEKSPDGRAEFRRLGGRGVPMIVVGGQRMNGYSEARLGQLLSEAGY
jgi:glutaredoxin